MIRSDVYLVDSDLTCTRCGYSLRGLTSDGMCPECGSAILDSLASAAVKKFSLTPPLPRWIRVFRLVYITAFILMATPSLALWLPARLFGTASVGGHGVFGTLYPVLFIVMALGAVLLGMLLIRFRRPTQAIFMQFVIYISFIVAAMIAS